VQAVDPNAELELSMILSATLPFVADLPWDERVRRTEDGLLDQQLALDRFLAGVEKRAFRIAKIALRDGEDALDCVQEAMLQLARRYSRQPEAEWTPLFHRILQNKIRDCQRKRLVRSIFVWAPRSSESSDEYASPLMEVADAGQGPADAVSASEAMGRLERALRELPARQREAFMLRALEELDVAQTAMAMGCTEGSVKTHYSRAVHALRIKLGDVW
jgi:RNA polymerase sigma-70 factor (ECF subfamily)